MTSMLLHCGGNPATFEEVCAVPVPDATNTWHPVPYRDVLSRTRDRTQTVLGASGFKLKTMSFGLNRGGKHMFALLSFVRDNVHRALSIGLRQGYDKSISLGFCTGQQVFVCDNLAFSGNSTRVLRKNTLHAWRDFCDMLENALICAPIEFKTYDVVFNRWEQARITQDVGYGILGCAVGNKVLKPHQAAIAFGDWQEPRHEEFAPRNLWSLYNCCTEGLKRSQPGQLLQDHARLSTFFTDHATKLAA